jgi:hypothetical protein
MEEVWFQQDAAPARLTLAVYEFLNEAVPGRWIGRGTAASPLPMPCPPRSSDLATPDNMLWEVINDKAAVCRYNTNAELRAAITNTFSSLTPQMLRKISQRTRRRIKLCADHDGAHADPQDQ